MANMNRQLTREECDQAIAQIMEEVNDRLMGSEGVVIITRTGWVRFQLNAKDWKLTPHDLCERYLLPAVAQLQSRRKEIIG
jgi:hypothetical protein